MNTEAASPLTTASDNLFGPLISSYSRAQAIADGALIDVTETAFEAGFQWPVAISRRAWEDCVDWSAEDSARQIPQDVDGRLWDVLWMAWVKVRCSLQARVGEPLLYGLRRVPRGGRGRLARLVTLKLLSGPGDHGEPVFTIVLPDED